MNPIGFIFGVIVTVVSLVILFGYAIPNVQQAQENVKIAQMEYDQSQAELDAAMNELNTSVNNIQQMCDTGEVTGC